MIIKLTYFKQSGKYYSEGDLEVTNADRPWEIYDQVRTLLKTRTLPGLIEGHSNFTIHVHIPDGVPAIISEFSLSEDATPAHQTMLELLDYPNPEGLHPDEVRWRNFARALLGKPTQQTHVRAASSAISQF